VPGYLKIRLAQYHMMDRDIVLAEVKSKSYLLVNIADKVYPLARIKVL
jgi:hypothetical protein